MSAAKIQIQLPDGTLAEYPSHTTAQEIAAEISEAQASRVIAAQVAGRIVDAQRALGDLAEDNTLLELQLLTARDPESLSVLRHSAAHLLARAVMRLYEDVSLGSGSATSTGCYQDVEMPHNISVEDFPMIEAEMDAIIKEGESFERFSLDRQEAIKLCQDLRQDLKVAHIQADLSEEAFISFYRQGEFVDVCRGPHLPDVGSIKTIKLLRVAQSHGEGEGPKHALQRLFGDASFDDQESPS